MHNIVIRKDLKLKSGLYWIKQAFVIFREQPLQFLILEIFTAVLSLLPFLGGFFGPLLIAKFMYCANKVEQHESIKIGEEFKNLFSNRLVVRLAFLNFCLNAIITLVQYFTDSYFDITVLAVQSIITATIVLISILLLSASMWLSPAICQFNKDIEPKIALWLSLKVCFHNIIALVAFSVIISAISLMIGLPIFLILLKLWNLFHSVYIMIPFVIIFCIIILVWLAILNISTYCIYKSVYSRSL